MGFFEKLVLALRLINQLLPGVIEAIATGTARLRAVQVTSSGHVYRVAGAGPVVNEGEQPDDLRITVV